MTAPVIRSSSQTIYFMYNNGAVAFHGTVTWAVSGGDVRGTVTDRSLRDAISLENARFHGTTRRSFPTGRGDPAIRKRWKIHV